MSYYLQLRAVQSPFSIGPDKNNRELISCNYDTERYDSNTLLESDITALIDSNNIVPFDPSAPTLKQGISHITIGSRAVLPPVPTVVVGGVPPIDGPWVRIISTGGYASDINRSSIRAEKPSCQILVASLSLQLASEKAWQIYRLLDGKRHTLAA